MKNGEGNMDSDQRLMMMILVTTTFTNNNQSILYLRMRDSIYRIETSKS